MHPHPDVGVLVFTVSVLLVFLELNRPGMVLPGAAGLLGVLLVIASATQWTVQGGAVLLLIAGTAAAAWQFRHTVSPSWAALAALAWVLGFRLLVSGQTLPAVHWSVALPCGITLGMGASLLARIAHRARRNKGLN